MIMKSSLHILTLSTGATALLLLVLCLGATPARSGSSQPANPAAAKTSPAPSTDEKWSHTLMLNRLPLSAVLKARGTIEKAVTAGAPAPLWAWTVLHKARTSLPIAADLSALSKIATDPGAESPFRSDWAYYRGLAETEGGNHQAAIKLFQSISPSDSLYLMGKYQEAMIRYETGKSAEAIVIFSGIAQANSLKLAPSTSKETASDVRNMARLALGRIAYENRKFREAIASFRAVDRSSRFFYDALFEQSWAFFLGGFPNQALGALYSVHTPYFANRYNPEAKVLESLVSYWICRFDDGKDRLSEYVRGFEEDREKVSSLASTLTSPEAGFAAYLTYLRSPQSSSLPMPRNIYREIERGDALQARKKVLVALVQERSRLRSIKWQERDQVSATAAVADLAIYETRVQSDIGKLFTAGVQQTLAGLEDLSRQTEFLYIEMLMGKKDQVLGKSLSLAPGDLRSEMKKNLTGFAAGGGQSWSEGAPGEIWWDEVGFYVGKYEPQCKAAGGQLSSISSN